MTTTSIPIIYSERYNIELGGIEKYHPFDTSKYRKAHDDLIAHGFMKPEAFIVPEPVTEEQLLLVHTKGYLDSLSDPLTAAQIAEVTELSYLPPLIIEEGLYTPLKLATGGTILGARLALERGAAVNLSGGFHHAKRSSGGGFCYYADIAIAVNVLWQDRPELKILIVDLDAHQGNGTASIFGEDARVAIFDMYNAEIFPLDGPAARFIDFPVRLRSRTDTATYLTLLEHELPRAIEKTRPDLVVYNAGTDVFENDPLGKLSISEEGIIRRDEFVFREARRHGLPILMLLAGGYTQESGHIIARSLENLLRTRAEN